MYVNLIGIFRAFSLFHEMKLNESFNELTTSTTEKPNETNLHSEVWKKKTESKKKLQRKQKY